MENSNVGYFSSVNRDILRVILMFLNFVDLLSLRLVNKHLCSLITNGDNIWKFNDIEAQDLVNKTLLNLNNCLVIFNNVKLDISNMFNLQTFIPNDPKIAQYLLMRMFKRIRNAIINNTANWRVLLGNSNIAEFVKGIGLTSLVTIFEPLFQKMSDVLRNRLFEKISIPISENETGLIFDRIMLKMGKNINICYYPYDKKIIFDKNSELLFIQFLDYEEYNDNILSLIRNRPGYFDVEELTLFNRFIEYTL